MRQRPVDVLFPNTQLPLASQGVKKKVQTPLLRQSSVVSHRIASPRTAMIAPHAPQTSALEIVTCDSHHHTQTQSQVHNTGNTTIANPKSQYIQHRLRPCQHIINTREGRLQYLTAVAIRNVPPAHPPLRRRARAAQNRRAEWVHVPLSVRNASVGEME